MTLRVLHRVMLSCLLGAWLGACPGSAAIERVNAPAGVQVSVLRVDVGDVAGISGAALDRRGRLWVVAERGRKLLSLRRNGTSLVAHRSTVVLEGLTDDLETESLTWLDDATFLLGTETSATRTGDTLLLMQLDGARARVKRRLRVDYQALGIRVDGNHGVEGACSVGDLLVLGVEVRSAQAMAPLVVHDLARGTWRSFQLKLSTATGKLASLDCRRGPTGETLDVIAIERHYGVGRVLLFSLELGDVLDVSAASDRVIEPTVLLDLATVLDPLPNFESVVWVDDALIVVTDNHHGRVTGPTQALRITGLRLPVAQKR